MSNYVKLDPARVQALFETATTQSEYILGLFRMVHPDFDEIVRLGDYVSCSRETWLEICGLAQMADRRIAPKCLPGGAWMNYGFSATHGEPGADLALWYVAPCPEDKITRVKAGAA